ncbi:MAG: phasin family protein [Hyphomicrobiaceae bacterium]
MSDKQFEIPDPIRELAERNVEQARSAYSQFLDMARKAQDMVAQSSDAFASGAREMQGRALKYAEENVDASFGFASDLARARDLKEYVEIQQRFARRQMETLTRQAQELNKLMAEAAQKAQKKP